MNRTNISFLIMGLILCSSLSAQTFVSHYPPSTQMSKADCKNNRQTLQLSKQQSQTFSKGKDTLYVNGAARWYAGIELGMPLGVSTFSSFASAGKAGFAGGVLGGYRISPLLSVEAALSAGTMRLGAGKCCSDYWLGADGVRYLEQVVGMDSYSYKDVYSSVSVQQYALRLHVDLLQIVRPDWDKRWSLTVSPAIYGIGTQATLKEDGTKTTVVERDGRFRFGAGAGIGGSYQVTGNLGIGLRSGVVWVSGGRFDGITPTDHKENMIWNNTVTLIWRFGSNQ